MVWWTDAPIGVVVGLGASVPVFAFASRFETGATLSGLNPDGGGPGFLILLASGILSLALRRRVEPLAPLAATINAVLVAAIAGLTAWLALSLAPSTRSIDLEPIVSAIAGAAFVPRVVAAVLSDAWSRHDAQSTT